MAYGRHWEWRGFGSLPEDVRANLEQLPTKFPKPEIVVDEYLWMRGGTVNIKLRSRGNGSLKLKRFETSKPGGLELWVEKPEEEYFFPLPPHSIQALAIALSITLPEAAGPVDRSGLLTLVSQAAVPIRRVSVQKRRDTRVYATAGGSVLVEIADIDRPESVTSVSVEDEYQLAADTPPSRVEQASAAVAEAVKALKLDTYLRTMNYLQALDIWSNPNLEP